MNEKAENAEGKTQAMMAAVLAGDRRALAKAISLAEASGPQGAAVMKALRGRLGQALVLGVTGPPGAGKSTLVSAMTKALRARGRRVGIVAVDPSSPVSGGAILGDRIRMSDLGEDDGVFIRSLASGGETGGLSPATARVVDVMDGAGWEVVIVETVGAGQAEVDVAEVAEIKLVVSAPGLGDDIQSIKAGILEIADILVVNKADQPFAERTYQELRAMVALRDDKAARRPVLKTTATTGDGIEALIDAVEARAGPRDPAEAARRRKARGRRLLAQEAARQARKAVLEKAPAEIDSILTAVDEGEAELGQAARRMLKESFGKDD